MLERRDKGEGPGGVDDNTSFRSFAVFRRMDHLFDFKFSPRSTSLSHLTLGHICHSQCFPHAPPMPRIVCLTARTVRAPEISQGVSFQFFRGMRWIRLSRAWWSVPPDFRGYCRPVVTPHPSPQGMIGRTRPGKTETETFGGKKAKEMSLSSFHECRRASYRGDPLCLS